MQEDELSIPLTRVPKTLVFPLKSEIASPEDLLEIVDRAFIVYQTLFMQASINREKVQHALIVDGSLPES
jgi:hypothetical protein